MAKATFEGYVSDGTRRHGRIEAGYQNLYNDKGNWTGGAIGVGNQAGTNMSIAAPTLSDWRGHDVTASEMQALTKAEALQIYKVKYFDAVLGGEFDSQTLANFTADMKSSAGGNGIKELQKSLNELGDSVAIDGAVGPQTIAAINRQNAAELNNVYREKMIDYYNRIGTGTNEQFLAYWIKSLNRDYPEMSVTAEKMGLPEWLNNKWWIIVASGIALVLIIILFFYFRKNK